MTLREAPHFPMIRVPLEPELGEEEGNLINRNVRKQYSRLSEIRGPWRPSTTQLTLFFTD